MAACHEPIADTDNAFYNWDGRRVHCAINMDSYTLNDRASLEAGLDRARDRGEVIEIYTHDPGRTVSWDDIEAVLSGARDRGLAFVTYADMATGATPAAGLALSFDDAYVPDWMMGRDLFMRYGARLTFFIAYFDQLSQSDRASLHQLAADGHDIEAHSVKHLRGPVVVEQDGLATYMSDEVQPSIDWLVADGFAVTTYAYPYGARTGETDDAILSQVRQLRSVSFAWSGVVTDPCPY